MAIKKEKYINALDYFIAECGNQRLGVTKLNKLFYYLDFISFRDRGASVTGETYIHLPMGPFASSLQKEIIPSAQASKLIEQKENASEKYGKRHEYVSLKRPDLSLFDEYEQELLAFLCENFKSWSTDQMIAQTHVEAPWVFSKPSQNLDYDQAYDIAFFTPSAK